MSYAKVGVGAILWNDDYYRRLYPTRQQCVSEYVEEAYAQWISQGVEQSRAEETRAVRLAICNRLYPLQAATPVCPTAGDTFASKGQFQSSDPRLTAATYGECLPGGPTNWECPTGYEASSISLTARSGERWHGALCTLAAETAPLQAEPQTQTVVTKTAPPQAALQMQPAVTETAPPQAEPQMQPAVTPAAVEEAAFETNGTRKLLIAAAVVGCGYLLWRMAK